MSCRASIIRRSKRNGLADFFFFIWNGERSRCIVQIAPVCVRFINQIVHQLGIPISSNRTDQPFIKDLSRKSPNSPNDKSVFYPNKLHPQETLWLPNFAKILSKTSLLGSSAKLDFVGTLQYHEKQGTFCNSPATILRHFEMLLDGDLIFMRDALAASLSMKMKTLRWSNLSAHLFMAIATGKTSRAHITLGVSAWSLFMMLLGTTSPKHSE